MEKEKVAQKPNEEKKKKNNLFLIIIIFLLLLALVAFFFVRARYSQPDPDVTIVKIMNEAYQVYEQANGKVTNEHDAHQAMIDRGYIIEDLLLIKPNRVVSWDSVNDCFVLLENEEVFYSPAEKSATGEDLWTYTRNVPTSSKHSVFWCGTEKVVREVVVGQDKNGKDIVKEKEISYTDHQYTKNISSESITYTCAECGKTYSVTREK